MNERRQLERFELKIPARIMASYSGRKKEMVEVCTNNISAGGAYCRTDHAIPEGTRVHLDFILPAKELVKLIGVSSFIKIAGTVVRSEDFGVAICFDNHYEMMPFKA